MGAAARDKDKCYSGLIGTSSAKRAITSASACASRIHKQQPWNARDPARSATTRYSACRDTGPCRPAVLSGVLLPQPCGNLTLASPRRFTTATMSTFDGIIREFPGIRGKKPVSALPQSMANVKSRLFSWAGRPACLGLLSESRPQRSPCWSRHAEKLIVRALPRSTYCQTMRAHRDAASTVLPPQERYCSASSVTHAASTTPRAF